MPLRAVTGEAVLSFTQLTQDRRGTGSLDGFPFSLRDQRALNVVAVRNDWTVLLGERALLRAGLEAARLPQCKVKKDGGDIAYHTGATISARALTRAVGRITAFAAGRLDALFAAPAGSRLGEQS